MSAATLTRTPAAPHGFDRLVLLTGMTLVAWSRHRSARSARRAHVLGVTVRPISDHTRAGRMFDPYSPEATRSHGMPPTLGR